jgi:hypothetical protein
MNRWHQPHKWARWAYDRSPPRKHLWKHSALLCGRNWSAPSGSVLWQVCGCNWSAPSGSVLWQVCGRNCSAPRLALSSDKYGGPNVWPQFVLWICCWLITGQSFRFYVIAGIFWHTYRVWLTTNLPCFYSSVRKKCNLPRKK